MIRVKIETENGFYTVNKPMGRYGAIHFGIVTKYMPSRKKGDTTPFSPLEQERIGQAFEEWATKVLPNILVRYEDKLLKTEIEPLTVDDVPGEDQFSIFSAMCSLINMSEDCFRIVSKSD